MPETLLMRSKRLVSPLMVLTSLRMALSISLRDFLKPAIRVAMTGCMVEQAVFLRCFQLARSVAMAARLRSSPLSSRCAGVGGCEVWSSPRSRAT
jgi:hypothetical protein